MKPLSCHTAAATMEALFAWIAWMPGWMGWRVAENKIRYLITGLRPAHSKAANDFLAACDLGVTGAFIPYRAVMTCTLAPDITAAQLAAQPGGIKKSFEALGFADVKVEKL